MPVFAKIPADPPYPGIGEVAGGCWVPYELPYLYIYL